MQELDLREGRCTSQYCLNVSEVRKKRAVIVLLCERIRGIVSLGCRDSCGCCVCAVVIVSTLNRLFFDRRRTCFPVCGSQDMRDRLRFGSET